MIWRAFALKLPDPRLAAHTEAAHERSNNLLVSNSYTRARGSCRRTSEQACHAQSRNRTTQTRLAGVRRAWKFPQRAGASARVYAAARAHARAIFAVSRVAARTGPWPLACTPSAKRGRVCRSTFVQTSGGSKDEIQNACALHSDVCFGGGRGPRGHALRQPVYGVPLCRVSDLQRVDVHVHRL